MVDTPARWICLRTNGLFYAFFFGSNLAFSVITSLPGFDEAFDDDLKTSPFFSFILLFSVGVLLATCAWHILYAKKTLRTFRDFRVFVLSRVVTLSALSVAYYVIRSESTPDGTAKLHLHHYFVSWLVSLFAAFNHKVSIIFLAITSGIFVQGIGAYSAASMFYRGDNDKPCPEVYYG